MGTLGCGVVGQRPWNPSNDRDGPRENLAGRYDDWATAMAATDDGGFALAGENAEGTTTGDTPDSSGPGFGPVAALIALVVGTFLRARR